MNEEFFSLRYAFVNDSKKNTVIKSIRFSISYVNIFFTINRLLDLLII